MHLTIVWVLGHCYNLDCVNTAFKRSHEGHKDMVYFKEARRSQFMRIFLLTALFLTGSPLYADQPLYQATAPHKSSIFKRPVDFSWAGPYIGGYVGGASTNANLVTNAGSITTSSYFSSSADIASVNQSGTNALHPSSPLVGIQLGDNFLVSRFIIVGLVLDYGYFHLNETNTANNISYPSGAGGYTLQTSISTNWLYTVRGRLGWVAPTSWPLMLYATGGLGVANLNVSNSLSDTTSLAGEGGGNSSNNQTGWTVGAGLEFPLIQHVTINVEYLYLDLGTVNTNNSIQNSAGGFGIPANSLSANFFKIGLNYKF